jgi:hypothetical protein
MLTWLSTLPIQAFGMGGSTSTTERVAIYSAAPPSASIFDTWNMYPSVSYQVMQHYWGNWRGVLVAFHRPASGESDNETVYAAISFRHWNDPNLGGSASPSADTWKRLILRYYESSNGDVFHSDVVFRDFGSY